MFTRKPRKFCDVNSRSLHCLDRPTSCIQALLMQGADNLDRLLSPAAWLRWNIVLAAILMTPTRPNAKIAPVRPSQLGWRLVFSTTTV
eukprot:353354-Chlamydomonas_euryale.AAC.6